MSVNFDAEQVILQNGFQIYDEGTGEGDFTVPVVEYVVDDCIDTVNLLFEQDIAAMSGEAGSKTVTCSRAQSPVLKMLISLVLRENRKSAISSSSSTGSGESESRSVGVGGLSVSEGSSISSAISASATINNPANTVYVDLFLKAGKKLMGSPPIYVGNAPLR